MAKKISIPGLGSEHQQFVLCIALHFCFPLAIPFLAEALKDGSVSTKSLTLTGSVYLMSLGFSSKNQLIFGLSLLSGVVLVLLFGVSNVNTESIARWVAYFCFVLITISHLIERWNRHVCDGTPYFEFGKG